jgi:hypothetical protein
MGGAATCPSGASTPEPETGSENIGSSALPLPKAVSLTIPDRLERPTSM